MSGTLHAELSSPPADEGDGTWAWIRVAWLHILATPLACCCVPLSQFLNLSGHQFLNV